MPRIPVRLPVNFSSPCLCSILARGIVCIKRSGSDPEKLIQENDLLYEVSAWCLNGGLVLPTSQ
jgi:hypothetical protein